MQQTNFYCKSDICVWFNIQIAPDPVYAGVYAFLKHMVPNYGVEVTFVPSGDIEAYRKAVKSNTKVITVSRASLLHGMGGGGGGVGVGKQPLKLNRLAYWYGGWGGGVVVLGSSLYGWIASLMVSLVWVGGRGEWKQPLKLNS